MGAQNVTTGGIQALLEQHWAASAAGDVVAEHDIYDENVICEYPQSGERISGRRNLQACGLIRILSDRYCEGSGLPEKSNVGQSQIDNDVGNRL